MDTQSLSITTSLQQLSSIAPLVIFNLSSGVREERMKEWRCELIKQRQKKNIFSNIRDLSCSSSFHTLKKINCAYFPVNRTFWVTNTKKCKFLVRQTGWNRPVKNSCLNKQIQIDIKSCFKTLKIWMHQVALFSILYSVLVLFHLFPILSVFPSVSAVFNYNIKVTMHLHAPRG